MGLIHITQVDQESGREVFAGRIETHRVAPLDHLWPYAWENVPVQGVAVAIGTGQGRRRAGFEVLSSNGGTLTFWEFIGNIQSAVLRLRDVPLQMAPGQLASGTGELLHSANPRFHGRIHWNTLL